MPPAAPRVNFKAGAASGPWPAPPGEAGELRSTSQETRALCGCVTPFGASRIGRSRSGAHAEFRARSSGEGPFPNGPILAGRLMSHGCSHSPCLVSLCDTALFCLKRIEQGCHLTELGHSASSQEGHKVTGGHPGALWLGSHLEAMR